MSGPRDDATDPTLPDRVAVWPHLVRIEMLAALVAMVVLTAWSILVDAPLESPADPNRTPDPSKAPWYFLGLQELLVYFDPWIAGVMIPLAIVVGLILIPYLDTNANGNGYFTFMERPFAITVFLAGFVGLWVMPIFIGVFCRGPGWAWVWPWEPWETATLPELPNANLSDLLGISPGPGAMMVGATVVLGWYGLGLLGWVVLRERASVRRLGPWRYAVVAFLLLSMAAIPVKMVLSWTLNLKYVWVTPWFNV